MNWGKGIVLSFVLFLCVIVTMVVISMRQEVGLVAPDYYKQEIAYQDQIDRMNNYNQLAEKPSITIDRANQHLVVNFPPSLTSQVSKGEIQIFRPSTTGIDKKLELSLDSNGEQRIDLNQMLKGRWKAKLFWQGDSEEQQYYNETAINI